MEAALLPIVLTVSAAFVVAVGWALNKWAGAVDQKVKNEYANDVLKRFGALVATVVKEVQQTVVDELKSSDKWTKETAKEAKDAALNKLKEYLGVKGLKEVMDILGVSDGSLLDRLLSSFIEAEVKDISSASEVPVSPR